MSKLGTLSGSVPTRNIGRVLLLGAHADPRNNNTFTLACLCGVRKGERVVVTHRNNNVLLCRASCEISNIDGHTITISGILQWVTTRNILANNINGNIAEEQDDTIVRLRFPIQDAEEEKASRSLERLVPKLVQQRCNAYLESHLLSVEEGKLWSLVEDIYLFKIADLDPLKRDRVGRDPQWVRRDDLEKYLKDIPEDAWETYRDTWKTVVAENINRPAAVTADFLVSRMLQYPGLFLTIKPFSNTVSDWRQKVAEAWLPWMQLEMSYAAPRLWKPEGTNKAQMMLVYDIKSHNEQTSAARNKQRGPISIDAWQGRTELVLPWIVGLTESIPVHLHTELQNTDRRILGREWSSYESARGENVATKISETGNYSPEYFVTQGPLRLLNHSPCHANVYTTDYKHVLVEKDIQNLRLSEENKMKLRNERLTLVKSTGFPIRQGVQLLLNYNGALDYPCPYVDEKGERCTSFDEKKASTNPATPSSVVSIPGITGIAVDGTLPFL